MELMTYDRMLVVTLTLTLGIWCFELHPKIIGLFCIHLSVSAFDTEPTSSKLLFLKANSVSSFKIPLTNFSCENFTIFFLRSFSSVSIECKLFWKCDIEFNRLLNEHLLDPGV